MGAGTCIGFESARALWRKIGHDVARDNRADDAPPLLVRLLFDSGEGLDLSALPARTRVSAAPARVVAHEVSELLGQHPELGGRLDVCVSEQAGRHVAAGATVHLTSGSYPPGSFYRMPDGTLLASPELTFVQLARTLSDDGLLAYGYELCGYYARGAEGFCSCPKLTSTGRMGRYLAAARGPGPGDAPGRQARAPRAGPGARRGGLTGGGDRFDGARAATGPRRLWPAARLPQPRGAALERGGADLWDRLVRLRCKLGGAKGGF